MTDAPEKRTPAGGPASAEGTTDAEIVQHVSLHERDHARYFALRAAAATRGILIVQGEFDGHYGIAWPRMGHTRHVESLGELESWLRAAGLRL